MKFVSVLVIAALFALALPSALGEVGASTGVSVETERFAPRVWMCDHRVVLDDEVEPGTFTGSLLVERVENYAFEGEQVGWTVLVMDKNGIDKVKDVRVTVGTEQGEGNDVQANCARDTSVTSILSSCNARLDEEVIDEFDGSTMQYYNCLFTVEPAGGYWPKEDGMYGEYWVTVEAEDLDGYLGVADESEFWFFNPEVAITIDGAFEFGVVRPGTDAYSDTILVGNDAVEGSGVLMNMFVSGTDFYDPESSGAKCPSTNQLSLDEFAYYATNGAYSTEALSCVDAEGYKGIPHGNRITQADELLGCDAYGPAQYKPGNVLSTGSEMAVTLRLSLPEPCNGDFSDGQIYFWGEAI